MASASIGFTAAAARTGTGRQIVAPKLLGDYRPVVVLVMSPIYLPEITACKKVVEIGCGQGEFLTMLAEMGNNRGIGFDGFTAAAARTGSGRQIVAPKLLGDYRPVVVLVMSPIYLPEITAKLDSMNVRPSICSASKSRRASPRPKLDPHQARSS